MISFNDHLNTVDWDDWSSHHNYEARSSLEKELGGLVFSNYSTAVEAVLLALVGTDPYPVLMAASAPSDALMAMERRGAWCSIVDIDPATVQASPTKLEESLNYFNSNIVFITNPFNQNVDSRLLNLLSNKKLMVVHLCEGLPSSNKILESVVHGQILITRLPSTLGAAVFVPNKDLGTQIKALRDNVFFDQLVALESSKIKERFNYMKEESYSLVLGALEECYREELLTIKVTPLALTSNHWYGGYPVAVENAPRACAHLKSYDISSKVFPTILDITEDIQEGYIGCAAVQNTILCLPLYPAVTMKTLITKTVNVLSRIEGHR